MDADVAESLNNSGKRPVLVNTGRTYFVLATIKTDN